MICESNVFFQKLERLAKGRFQTYPEDILEAPGGVIWVPGGAPEGVRTKQAGFGRAQGLHKNT